MNAPIIPPAQSIFVLTVVALVVLAFLVILVLKIAIFLAEKRAGVEYRWEPPQTSDPGPIRRWIEAHAAKQEARYTPRRYVVMSYQGDDAPQEKAPVPPAVATFTTAEQPIVTPNNEYSNPLSNSSQVAFETTAKSIAVMYQKGVVTNLSKAICAAYGCTVQSASKPDSTYQLALKAVNKHLPKPNAPQFRMTPEMENAREALGLNQH